MMQIRSAALTIHHDRSTGSGAPGATEAIALALERAGVSASVHGFDLLPSLVPGSLKPLLFPLAVRSFALNELRRGTTVIDASTGDLAALRHSELAGCQGIVITRSHGLEHLAVDARRQGAARGELVLRRRYGLYHGGIRLGIVARSLRLADGVFALSEHEATYMVEHLGVERSRVALTTNGIDDALISLPFVAPSTKVRSIALMGPASWRKGGDVAVELVERILERDPSLTVTWVGIDNQGRQLLSRAQLRHHQRLQLIERYDRAELPRIFASSQVLVSTSRTEGMPLSLLEAAACSLPVVAVDISGVRDVVVTAGCGVLVERHDAAAIDNIVTRLLDDPGHLDDLARRAHRFAQSASWDAVVSSQLEFESELLARKGCRG